MLLSIDNLGLVRFDGKTTTTIVKWEDVEPTNPKRQAARNVFVSGTDVYFQMGSVYRYSGGTVTSLLGNFDPSRKVAHKSICGSLVRSPDGGLFVGRHDLHIDGAKGWTNGPCNHLDRVLASGTEPFADAPANVNLSLTQVAVDGRGRVWLEADRTLRHSEGSQWKDTGLGLHPFDAFVPIGDGILVGHGDTPVVLGDESIGDFDLPEFEQVLAFTADGRSPLVAAMPDLDGSTRGGVVVRKLLPRKSTQDPFAEWTAEAPLPELTMKPERDFQTFLIAVDERHRTWVATERSIGAVGADGRPLKGWPDARATFGGEIVAIAVEGPGPSLDP